MGDFLCGDDFKEQALLLPAKKKEEGTAAAIEGAAGVGGDNEPLRKKSKTLLPPSVSSKLCMDTVDQVISFAAGNVDSVKTYDNARRFEKKRPKEENPYYDEDDDHEIEPPMRDGGSDFVEFYWDNHLLCSKSVGTLRKVTGVHRNGSCPAFRFDSDDMLPAPKVETGRHDDIKAKVDELSKELLENGYIQVERFLDMHKVHLPCFTRG